MMQIATPVFLPGESQGWGRLVGCHLWGRTELDTTEQLHFHFSLSCIGEENGNPLQCSCLENPRDGDAWWAAVYGVAQSRTQLKRLGSSSSSFPNQWSNHEHIFFLSFLKYLFIYLAALGLSCSMWDLQSLLWHVRSFYLQQSNS